MESISAIIPTYNASSSIIETIKSILCQTHPVIEIIVIDDGSKDSTYITVQDYVATHSSPIPIILKKQENGGPAAARNHGARLAKGDWLAFLDADDTWLPEKLACQLPHMTSPNTVLVHSTPHPILEPITFETLWRRNQIVNSTVLVRRQSFEKVGGFDEDRALISVEDYNLWLRLIQVGKFSTCKGDLIHYTPGENSLSSQIQRFHEAEIANIEKIGNLFSLSNIKISDKRYKIHIEYGKILIYQRKLRQARSLLFLGAQSKLTIPGLLWLGSTFLPRWILDLRRSKLQNPLP